VAVLPFSNETNDVDGPQRVRKVFIALLPTRGYNPLSWEEVDHILQTEFGITEGGQLGSVAPAELARALHVDGLFYGNVITFVDFPFGFGRKRTVKTSFKLVEPLNNELLWEDVRSWTTPEIHLSAQEAREAVKRQILERQLEKMNDTFLLDESRIVVQRALLNLPLAK